MKVRNLTFLASLALASGVCCAEELKLVDFKEVDKESLDDTSFIEQFQYEDLEKSDWKVSSARKNEQFSYVGYWAIEEPKIIPGMKGDKGLVMKKAAAHHAISYKLDKPFNNHNNDLVLQYEVKFQEGISCGGAYIKLLNDDFDNLGEFNSETPYQVMFGPDICGASNKVRFILKRYNPILKEMEEKQLVNTPFARTGKVSTLYTLVLKKNQDFEIRINGEIAVSGNLVTDVDAMNPPIEPPREIPDEFALNLDEEDVEEGSEVTKEESIPEGWNENEEPFITKPGVTKPKEWDDEEDGVWEPPMIPNPKCANGCGKWKPTVDNSKKEPEKDQQKKKGGKKLVANPKYYSDPTPSNIEPVGGLGFELWNMHKDILFDNIYLGHSVEEAERIGNDTFIPKFEAECVNEAASETPASVQPVPPPPTFNDILEEETKSFEEVIEFVKVLFDSQVIDIKKYIADFKENPIQTIVENPLVFIVYCTAIISVSSFLFVLLGVFSYYIFNLFSQTGYEEEKKKIENKSAKNTTNEELVKDKLDSHVEGTLTSVAVSDDIPTERQSKKK